MPLSVKYEPMTVGRILNAGFSNRRASSKEFTPACLKSDPLITSTGTGESFNRRWVPVPVTTTWFKFTGVASNWNNMSLLFPFTFMEPTS